MSDPDTDLTQKLSDTWHAVGLPQLDYSPPIEHFKEMYRRPQEFPSYEALEHVMRPLGLLPCPKCTTPPDTFGHIETVRLCVVVERMPLGAKGHMASAMCMVCGFKARWPARLDIHEFGGSVLTPMQNQKITRP